MTNYQLINDNLKTVVDLLNNHLITPKIIRNLEIYEHFHALAGTRKERYEVLAEKWELSTTAVKKIILKLNKKAK